MAPIHHRIKKHLLNNGNLHSLEQSREKNSVHKVVVSHVTTFFNLAFLLSSIFNYKSCDFKKKSSYHWVHRMVPNLLYLFLKIILECLSRDNA